VRSAAANGARVAVLYTSVFEALRDVKEEIREDMDLAINARSVTEALRSAGHDAWTHTFGKDPEELISRLRSSGSEAVFNLSECPNLSPEKELHACALLELLRLPYTGNGPLALGICNSKALAKQLMIANGIPTPRFRLYTCDPAGEPRLSYPLVVKPANEDGSAGITEDSVVADLAGLRRQVKWLREGFRQDSLVEEFVDGREFNVGVLGNGTAADPHRSLPPAELVPDPALAALHLRIEVELDASLVRGDRPGLPRQRSAGNHRAALGDHPGLRADLRARGIRPGRLPDERGRGAVRP